MIGFVSRRFYRLVAGRATVPVTLGLRNIYILPTGYGCLYLAGLVAMLIGSINYNNNLGFLLTFLLGSLAFTAMLHTYRMLYGLRLAAARSFPVFAGEPMDVEILVASVDRPRTVLHCFFESHPPVEISLLQGGDARVTVSAATAERGWFCPPRLRIACDYPLGLFRAWTRVNTNVRGIVYPQPRAGAAAAVEHPAGRGDRRNGAVAGTDDFIGLSTYQPGDPPQRIHWQAYSRGRGMHVKQFAGQEHAGTMLDLRRIKGDDVEKKLSVLCFHVQRAYRDRRNVGLILDRQMVPPGCGKAHRDRCLRALALFQGQ